MIQQTFALLLLIIASITYCMYDNLSCYDDRRAALIEKFEIQSKINALSFDDNKSIAIKQMWKDCCAISPFNNTEWITGYYFFTVLITAATIITCSIIDYKKDHSFFGIILSIGLPIVPTAVIWIVYLSYKKRYKHLHMDSIKDLSNSLDSKYINYYSIEKHAASIIDDKYTTKEKANRYYSALGIVLLIAIITLVTPFFNKSEYEIEEEQSRIEESYQSGYENGYKDGYLDGGRE